MRDVLSANAFAKRNENSTNKGSENGTKGTNGGDEKSAKDIGVGIGIAVAIAVAVAVGLGTETGIGIGTGVVIALPIVQTAARQNGLVIRRPSNPEHPRTLHPHHHSHP